MSEMKLEDLIRSCESESKKLSIQSIEEKNETNKHQIEAKKSQKHSILDKIKESKRKTILIINKIDLIKREKLLNLIDIYSKEYNFESVIPISAYQEKYRDIILDEIEKNLKQNKRKRK